MKPTHILPGVRKTLLAATTVLMATAMVIPAFAQATAPAPTQEPLPVPPQGALPAPPSRTSPKGCWIPSSTFQRRKR